MHQTEAGAGGTATLAEITGKYRIVSSKPAYGGRQTLTVELDNQGQGGTLNLQEGQTGTFTFMPTNR